MPKNASLILAIYLIVAGLLYLGVSIPYAEIIAGALAIAAGVLILIKK
jgi:hypothetical protein